MRKAKSKAVQLLKTKYHSNSFTREGQKSVWSSGETFHMTELRNYFQHLARECSRNTDALLHLCRQVLSAKRCRLVFPMDLLHVMLPGAWSNPRPLFWRRKQEPLATALLCFCLLSTSSTRATVSQRQ